MSSRYSKLQLRDTATRQPEPEHQDKRKVGRPRGKASNPDYEATTLLIRRVNKRKLQILSIEENRDMSDIVDSLIAEHLNGK